MAEVQIAVSGGRIRPEERQSWIETSRSQGQDVFTGRGLATLGAVLAAVLLSALLAAGVLLLAGTVVLPRLMGYEADLSGLEEQPLRLVLLLLVLAGSALGGGLDVSFIASDPTRVLPVPGAYVTGPVLAYLLFLWWILRWLYRRASRRQAVSMTMSAVVFRGLWEGLFCALPVMALLCFWQLGLELPQGGSAVLQNRWWSVALTVFLVVTCAAILGRSRYVRDDRKGVLELALLETAAFFERVIVVFTLVTLCVSYVIIPITSAPGAENADLAMIEQLLDPVAIGAGVAAVLLGGGLIAWNTIGPDFQALVEVPGPFTPDVGVTDPMLPVLAVVLVLLLSLRSAVVMGMRRFVAERLIAGRPQTAEVVWRRVILRGLSFPVLVAITLFLLQRFTVAAVSIVEPIILPPSGGVAPGYSIGAFLPWYAPVFGGVLALLISLVSALVAVGAGSGSPRLLSLLAWRSPVLFPWAEERALLRGEPPMRSAWSVEIRELEPGNGAPGDSRE
ncbi:hypothetical protein [Arthrobacter sp. NPDC090010]|uniref:hypothetical protein n=1 Tax=Arthrobacter sp. NPDC090010 TaxID=3363942 RepID=UPI0038194878